MGWTHQERSVDSPTAAKWVGQKFIRQTRESSCDCPRSAASCDFVEIAALAASCSIYALISYRSEKCGTAHATRRRGRGVRRCDGDALQVLLDGTIETGAPTSVLAVAPVIILGGAKWSTLPRESPARGHSDATSQPSAHVGRPEGAGGRNLAQHAFREHTGRRCRFRS